jgi:hypothetical protein
MTQIKIDKTNLRKILFIENATIFCLTGIFSKLVIFNHYRLINIPIKLLFTYLYFSSIEPFTIFSGYYANKYYFNT